MDRTVGGLGQWLPGLEGFVVNFLVAALILAVGWSLSAFAGRVVRKLAARSSRVDRTVVPMAHSITVWAIRIIVLIAALARLGVQTASIIAILGAAGLAVGLALQGTLQNIAAGIMLLALRPMRAGEFVSVVGKADGTVEEVGLFLSRFKQADGTYITLPNSLVWGNAIVNFSRNGTRRAEVQIDIPYGQDLDAALAVLRGLVQGHALVLQDPAPEVAVVEYRQTAAVASVRAWALAADHWTLLCELRREAPAMLEAAGVRLARRDPWAPPAA